MTTQTQWKHTYERVINTAPSHTFAPLLAALHFTEISKAEETLEEEWKGREDTTYGEPTRARALTTRVIN
jgi:hypothetical protein